MAKPASVDVYILDHPKWEAALTKFRSLLLDLGFAEAIKWQMPIYMIEGKNLIGVGAFKHHFSIWFTKGHLLSDPLGVLSNAQPGKTKEMRHWKWKSMEEMDFEAVRGYFAEVKFHAKELPDCLT